MSETLTEMPEGESTLLVSKRIDISKLKPTNQTELSKKFLEQMRNGTSGVIYNTETGLLEEHKR